MFSKNYSNMIYITIMPNTKHKKDTFEKVILLWNSGNSRASIAKITHLNVKTISNWLKELSQKQNEADQVKVISLWENGESISSISKITQINRRKISSWIKNSSNSNDQKDCTEKLRNCVRELRKDGKSFSEIQKLLDTKISTTTFYRWCSEIKSETQIHPLYKINEIKHDYFSNENVLNFPERFVIIGFIAADGCISDTSKGQKKLIFNLSMKDESALNIINTELADATRSISFNKKTKSFTLSFPSNQIANDLKRYNIIPRKTATFDLPNLSLKEMSYFLRGYYYGDGCFIKGKTPGTKGYHFIGNKTFAESLQNYLTINKILDRCKVYKIKNSDYKQIVIKGSQGHKFSNYIFSDDKLMLLQRKHILMTY